MAMAIESIIIRSACIFSANFLSLGLGCYLFVVSSTRDMKGTLRSINKNSKSIETVANRSRTLKRLSEFVQLHSKTRQLSLKFLNRNKKFSLLFSFCLSFFQSNIGICRILSTFSRKYFSMEHHHHWGWNDIGRNAISLVTNLFPKLITFNTNVD